MPKREGERKRERGSERANFLFKKYSHLITRISFHLVNWQTATRLWPILTRRGMFVSHFSKNTLFTTQDATLYICMHNYIPFSFPSSFAYKSTSSNISDFPSRDVDRCWWWAFPSQYTTKALHWLMYEHVINRFPNC